MEAAAAESREHPWFIAFYSSNCPGPDCLSLTPELEKLAAALQGNVSVGMADAEKRAWFLKDKWQLRRFPALKLLRDGQVYTYHGDRTAAEMEFFLAPPRYMGWEIAPPEEMPGTPSP